MSAADRTKRTKRANTTRTKRAGRGAGGRAPSASSSFKASLMVIIFVIVAFGGFLVVMNINYQKEKDAQAQKQQQLEKQLTAKIHYITASRRIEIGDEITQDKLSSKSFPQNTIIDGAYKKLESSKVTGKYAKQAIPAGQIILISNLQITPLNLKLDLAADEVEVKVPLTKLDQDLYYIKKGGKVSIYTSMTTSSGNQITKDITQDAKILFIHKTESMFSTDPSKISKALSNENKEPFMYLGMKKDDAKVLSKEMQEMKKINYLPEGEKAPPSTASILQIWTGVDMEEKEIVTTIGASMSHPQSQNTDDDDEY